MVAAPILEAMGGVEVAAVVEPTGLLLLGQAHLVRDTKVVEGRVDFRTTTVAAEEPAELVKAGLAT